MAPFTVLQVCMGNICRSPMAERLLVQAVRELVGAGADDLVQVHGAGTGGWHQGKPMDPSAARQLRVRNADPESFAARRLLAEHVDGSDLILTATVEQVDFVLGLRPDARGRTFVLGELGRLLADIDLEALPPVSPTPDLVYARGVALVEAADRAREGQPPLIGDELDDPWGRGDSTFARVADEIEDTVRPLAAALLSR